MSRPTTSGSSASSRAVASSSAASPSIGGPGWYRRARRAFLASRGLAAPRFLETVPAIAPSADPHDHATAASDLSLRALAQWRAASRPRLFGAAERAPRRRRPAAVCCCALKTWIEPAASANTKRRSSTISPGSGSPSTSRRVARANMARITRAPSRRLRARGSSIPAFAAAGISPRRRRAARSRRRAALSRPLPRASPSEVAPRLSAGDRAALRLDVARALARRPSIFAGANSARAGAKRFVAPTPPPGATSSSRQGQRGELPSGGRRRRRPAGRHDVVRGRDLLPATMVHRLLQSLLDLPPPRYRHHRLALTPVAQDVEGRLLAAAARLAGGGLFGRARCAPRSDLKRSN